MRVVGRARVGRARRARQIAHALCVAGLALAWAGERAASDGMDAPPRSSPGHRADPAAPPAAVGARRSATRAYEALLGKYVRGDRVAYGPWKAKTADVAALRAVVDSLEAEGAPDERRDALAYWLNLYNALTLDVVLAHYPISSIRAILPGDANGVWITKRVSVDGRSLSLDDIENTIVRPTFADPRVHFALNCASLGCPPLLPEPFTAERVDAQLDAVTRRALRDPRWASLEPHGARLTKIFEWFASDFTASAGSVGQFIARYRPEAEAARWKELGNHATFLEYDWTLNDERK